MRNWLTPESLRVARKLAAISTFKEQIVALLARNPGLTDREITNLIKGRTEPQQPVNTTCRELATKGVVERRRRADGLIGNYLTDRNTPQIAPAQMQEVRSVTANSTDELSEDALKKILAEWLERDGWTVKIAWGGQRGLDIEAVMRRQKKGEVFHWILAK